MAHSEALLRVDDPDSLPRLDLAREERRRRRTDTSSTTLPR
jgi:hypothetical protein